MHAHRLPRVAGLLLALTLLAFFGLHTGDAFAAGGGVGDFLRCEPGEGHHVVNRGDTPWKAVFVKAPYDPKDSVPIAWSPED